MDPAQFIASLTSSGEAIACLYSGITAEQARVRPAPGKWSLIEILGHLCDEEREDFRTRLRLMIEEPGSEWPGIDPEGWVLERDYQARDLQASLADFRKERAASLAWLSGLTDVDWTTAHTHPSLGELRAGDMFAAWVAHDLLHTRQIVATRLAALEQDAEPFTTRYAQP